MKNISISDCHQFLTVNDMKFMAFDGQTSGDLCKDCYFGPTNDSPRCEILFEQSYCTIHSDGIERIDNRDIIWMRIL